MLSKTMQNQDRLWWMVGLLILALPQIGLSAEAKTSGLRTNYSKVAVANLPIGQTVSMIQIANAPIVVGNNYAIPIFIKARTEKPSKAKDGYEPIPDSSWVTIEPDGATLAAGAASQLDVKISLPNDETLFGRKYFCHIVLLTEGDPNMTGVRFGTQITGLFMFSVAPARNEEGLDAALKNPSNAAFELTPPVVILNNIVPGQKLKVLTELKKKVELTNQSKTKQEYLLSAVNPRDTNYSFISNNIQYGNPNDMLISQEQVKLGPGKKKGLDIMIQVPPDIDLSKGSLAYLISVASGAKQGQGVNRYLAIYLNGVPTATEPKLENAAPQGVTTSAEIKNK